MNERETNRYRALILALLATTGVFTPHLLHAAEYYVSPLAGANGTGSKGSPMRLTWALSSQGPVRAGDVVWLRGGTYTGVLVSSLTGTQSAPIHVRAYPGETPILTSTLTINGAHTWYRGFEVLNPNTDRAAQRPSAIDVFGPGTKLLNLVIHDAGVGVGFWRPAVDAEINGCIIFNNGYQGAAPDRGHGHGIYAQNATGTKVIRNNLLFNQYGYGLSIYGESAELQGFVIEGNVSFRNGILTREGQQRCNFSINGTMPSDRVEFANNVAYHVPSTTLYSGGNNIEMGSLTFSQNHGNISIRSNYVAGGQISFNFWTNLVFEANTLAPFSLKPILKRVVGGSYRLDNNKYFKSVDEVPIMVDGKNYTIQGLRDTFGYENNGTFVSSMPNEQKVFVRRHEYEQNRGHVVVVNWGLANQVTVDVSAVLSVNAGYEVRNAQDIFAPPVLIGTYDGSLLTLPLTNQSAAQPLGWTTRPPSSGLQFNVFLIQERRPAPPNGISVVNKQ